MLVEKMARKVEDPRKRFWEKVEKTNDCWIWKAGKCSKGYGVFWMNGRNHLAHRVSYQWLIGEIPKGLCIDHLCKNSACVNPEHLEIVSLGENVLRGEGITAINSKKTHCPKGHMYDMVYGTSKRGCKTCNREKMRKFRARRKEEPHV